MGVAEDCLHVVGVQSHLVAFHLHLLMRTKEKTPLLQSCQCQAQPCHPRTAQPPPSPLPSRRFRFSVLQHTKESLGHHLLSTGDEPFMTRRWQAGNPTRRFVNVRTYAHAL